MLGLKSRNKISEVEELTAMGPTRPAVSAPLETLIPPTKHGRRGRRLTFAIDQTGIQMAAASAGHRHVRLLDVRKTYFPASAETESAKANFITRTVEEYLTRFGARSSFVSVTVTGGETAFRTFTMPPLKGKAFASAVRFEAKKQLPFPVGDCLYDFRPIYQTHTEGREGTRVALLAATKRVVGDQLAPFEQLGTEVHQIYHAQDVIGGLLKSLPDFSEEHHYTLVNVERTRTEIAYYRGNNLEFFHICSVGSSFLANRNDLTIFEYFAESLAGEIQNSLDYYSGQYSGQFNTRIYIYGDLSYSEELIHMLHDHFGYEFRRFPSDELDLGSGHAIEDTDSLAVCLPVLAATLNGFKLANLLPPERQARIRLRQQNRLGALSLIGLVLLLGLGWLGLRADITTTQGKLANVAGQVNSFKASELYDTYSHLKQQIAANQAYLEQIKPQPTYLSLSLKELSHLTPATIRLASLEYRPETADRNMIIQGVVSPSSVPPEVTLAEFVENLSASPFYDKVAVIGYSKRSTASGLEMEFQLGLKGTI